MPNFGAIGNILNNTFQDSIRAKWLIIFSIIYFLLAINIPLLVLLIANFIPPNFLQLYLSTFVQVAYPFVPLLTLPMGAAVIVDERESGTLQYMMANPISKFDFLLGRMVGMLLATTLVILVGFGIATVFVYGTDWSNYAPLLISAAAAGLLNAIMLGVAFILSVMSKRKATAIGIAVFLWLLFTVIGNIALLSAPTAIVGLFPTLLNPIYIAQDWAYILLSNKISTQTSNTLLITHIFGHNVFVALFGSLVLWLIVVWVVTFLIFRHQDVV